MRLRRFIVTLVLVAAILVSAPVRAMDRDVKAVLISGAYGLGAGTLLGVAAYPVSRDPTAIVFGTSIGLYLGLAVGFYFINNREDPENPLRMKPEDHPPDEDSSPYDQEASGMRDPGALYAEFTFLRF